MTIYGYARVSSNEQSMKGLSVDAQVYRLKTSGVDEKNIFIDSGKTAGVKEDMVSYIFKEGHYIIDINLNIRPEFVRLNKLLKEGDELRFTKHDRISRSSHLLNVFRHDCVRRGITLTPLEDTTDPLTIKIVAVINEIELETTTKRNLYIAEQSYLQGRFPYKAPIGYSKNSKDKDGKLRFPDLPEGCLTIDKPKAEMVKQIFKEMAQGTYYKDICERLGIKSQTLYDIVRNKTYLGMTHFGDEWKKSDAVPQIIEEELFNKAQENIKTK